MKILGVDKNKNGTIFLEPKTYTITNTIKLKNQFENIIIDGQGATISSGQLLDDWKLVEGIYYHNATDYPYSNQLLKNGELINRPSTAYVNSGSWDMNEDSNYIFYNQKEHQNKVYYEGYLCKYKELLDYKNTAAIEFIYDVGWTHCICPVENISLYNDEYVYIKMVQPSFRDCQIKEGMQINAPNQIVNIKEKLQPGQWYYDSNLQQILYMPLVGEDINNVEFILPTLDTLIDINNCHNITIKNIKFSHSSWNEPSIKGLPDGQANLCKNFDISLDTMVEYNKPASAITLLHSTNIIFENCKFTKLGCCGIDIDEGVKNVTIKNCDFHEIAANGLMIGQFNFKCGHEKDETLITEKIKVTNCEFNDIGNVYRSGVAIIAGYVRHTTISHNEIHDVAYTGISLGWGWGFDDPNYKYCDILHDRIRFGTFDTYPIMEDNHIDYNHIYNVMSKMHDGAGIYTLSMNQNSTIIGNYVHDNGTFKGIPYEKLFYFRIKTDMQIPERKAITERNSFPGGIYLDEGSGGFTVKDNVILNVACPLYYHYTGIIGVFETNKYINNYINGEKEYLNNNIINKAGKFS
ncbi:MAG: right-handed parallel beta-helix repeat-containing protein [Clostridiales bacterium]|nr:right-handed parallel beta-helix repeat-containing protein [Clostridiales bacterium]